MERYRRPPLNPPRPLDRRWLWFAVLVLASCAVIAFAGLVG